MMTVEDSPSEIDPASVTPERSADAPDRVTARREPPVAETPVRRAVRHASRMLALLLAAGVVWALVIDPFSHAVTQRRAEETLRSDLNMAIVPVETPAVAGRPLAFLEIDAIGLRRVVMAGTTAEVLADGPGHLRTSRMPGQPGVSVILGRRTLAGGDFSDLENLSPGDRIRTTTGQGESVYEVVVVRTTTSTDARAFTAEGDALLLMTAGSTFSSADRLVVEAELVSDPFPAGRRIVQSPPSPGELGLDGSRSSVPALLAWSELWLLAAGLTVWLAARWRPRPTWILAAPVHLALASVVFEHVLVLLPSML